MTRIPGPDEPFVAIRANDRRFRVYFEAGRPSAIVWISPHGQVMHAMAADAVDPRGDFAEAARQAVAFMEQFRLPAVAS